MSLIATAPARSARSATSGAKVSADSGASVAFARPSIAGIRREASSSAGIGGPRRDRADVEHLEPLLQQPPAVFDRALGRDAPGSLEHRIAGDVDDPDAHRTLELEGSISETPDGVMRPTVTPGQGDRPGGAADGEEKPAEHVTDRGVRGVPRREAHPADHHGSLESLARRGDELAFRGIDRGAVAPVRADQRRSGGRRIDRGEGALILGELIPVVSRRREQLGAPVGEALAVRGPWLSTPSRVPSRAGPAATGSGERRLPRPPRGTRRVAASAGSG